MGYDFLGDRYFCRSCRSTTRRHPGMSTLEWCPDYEIAGGPRRGRPRKVAPQW